jgi:hypothetical protein
MPVPWRLSASVTLYVQAQVPNDNGQQSDIVDRYSAPMSASPPALSTPQVFVVGQWLTFLAFAHTRLYLACPAPLYESNRRTSYASGSLT